MKFVRKQFKYQVSIWGEMWKVKYMKKYAMQTQIIRKLVFLSD